MKALPTATRTRGVGAVAFDIQVGDRVRITAKCRVRGVSPGESGIVLRVTRKPRRRPQIGEVAIYVVKLDRGEAIVAFYPDEVEHGS
jgi:hypothetical protein